MNLNLNNIFKNYHTYFFHKNIKCSIFGCNLMCGMCDGSQEGDSFSSKFRRFEYFLDKMPSKPSFDDVLDYLKKI